MVRTSASSSPRSFNPELKKVIKRGKNLTVAQATTRKWKMATVVALWWLTIRHQLWAAARVADTLNQVQCRCSLPQSVSLSPQCRLRCEVARQNRAFDPLTAKHEKQERKENTHYHFDYSRKSEINWFVYRLSKILRYVLSYHIKQTNSLFFTFI